MNMHEIIKRDNCTVCGRGNLNFLITTPPLPIFQGCVTEPETSDIKYPQNWVSCDSCGTVQLSSLLPLDLVYSARHAASFGICGISIMLHLRDLLFNSHLVQFLELVPEWVS
jgi:hypothetical protein